MLPSPCVPLFLCLTLAHLSAEPLFVYPGTQPPRPSPCSMIILETVAGIPGMVGAMWRHFSSLRTMKRDNGMIHTLLEAENERMHLLTFLKLRQPGILFRAMVLLGQGESCLSLGHVLCFFS